MNNQIRNEASRTPKIGVKPRVIFGMTKEAASHVPVIPKHTCPRIFRVFEVLCDLVPGSLPPSPADSGVSDVDSSSSGHASTDELKARLQPPGLGPHSPLGYHHVNQQQFLAPYHYPPGHGQPHRSHMPHQHHYPVRPQCKYTNLSSISCTMIFRRIALLREKVQV